MPSRPVRNVATITDIRRSGPAFRRRTIVLDGDPWRDVPAAVITALELEVSDEVDPSELDEMIETTAAPLARERALRLLTAKERSCAGLRSRLVDDGFSTTVAEATVADLQRIGLVDDERFARAFARTLAHARGLGRSRIARELQQAGVAEDLADAALEDALCVDDESAAAARMADAAASKPGATVDKVASRLVRRGYRLALALTVAREAIERRGALSGDDSASERPFDD